MTRKIQSNWPSKKQLLLIVPQIDTAEVSCNSGTVIVTLDAKRRLNIPATLVPTKLGDQFDATFDAEEDAVIFRRLPNRRSWLEVMKSCPVPVDDLPRRSREFAKKKKL